MGAQVQHLAGAVVHLRRVRHVAQAHDDAERLSLGEPATRHTGREAGVVDEHGAGADQHGVAGGAQGVGVGAGRVARDPLARAVGGGAAPVEGGRELPGHEGAAERDAAGPTVVERDRLVGEHSADHVDPGRVQPLGATRRVAGSGRTGRRRPGRPPRRRGRRRTARCDPCARRARGSRRRSRPGPARLPGAAPRPRRAACRRRGGGPLRRRCRPARRGRTRPGGWGRATARMRRGGGLAASRSRQSCQPCSARRRSREGRPPGQAAPCARP